MDATAERGQHAQPPVADLVAEALHDDRLVGRQHACGLALLAQEGDEVARRLLVEVRGLRQLFGLAVDRPARELTDGAPKLDGPAALIALPERDCAGKPRRGSDDHAIAGDLVDPTCGPAEQE